MDSIDNTNSEVQGTTNEITVTGSTDTGFVVGIDTAFSGRVTTVEAGLAAEITRATAAEGVLTTNLAAEVTARTAADTLIRTDFAAADALIAADLAAEVTRATAAEGVLTTNLAAEVTRATAAEGALQTAITAEETARIAADNAEAALRSAADATLTANLATLSTFVDRDSKVTEGTAVQVLADSVAIPVSAVQWIVHVQDAATPSKVSAYEVFAASSGTAVDFTRFGLLTLNSGVAGVVVTATLNGASGIDLSVTTAGNANIKIKRVAVV